MRVFVTLDCDGELYEFNFSKLHTRPWQQFNITLDETTMRWEIIATTRKAKIEIDFSCPRSHMLLMNYENPAGAKNHNQLWNGGHASGIVNLYRRQGRDYTLINSFDGKLSGCGMGSIEGVEGLFHCLGFHLKLPTG